MTVQHTDVAAYSLGLLASSDRADFEAHLAQCDSCPAELAELASMADLLAGIEPVETGPGQESDGQPVNELLSKRAVAHKRQVRRQSLFAVAASLVLLAGGVAAGVAAAPGKNVPIAELVGQRHSAIGQSGVTGTVGLLAKTWGTYVSLRLGGVHGPLECELVAVTRTGERRVVTGWLVLSPGDGVPGHPAPLLVQGGTAILAANLARFDVIVVNGPTLLSIPV